MRGRLAGEEVQGAGSGGRRRPEGARYHLSGQAAPATTLDTRRRVCPCSHPRAQVVSLAQVKGVQHLTLEAAAAELGMGTTQVRAG